MVQESSNVALSSLYSYGQCLLSVLGSIGVILSFAGIPQLIYAPQVNPGSLMTFLLGAFLITLMVGGNAFIGYKYRMLVRNRREESQNNGQPSAVREDKPPSYEDLLMEEGSPPAYTSLTKEKPPRYDDLVTEVFNWNATNKVQDVRPPPRPPLRMASSLPTSEETPIITPVHRNTNASSNSSHSLSVENDTGYRENPAFERSTWDLKTSESLPNFPQIMRIRFSDSSFQLSETEPSGSQPTTGGHSAAAGGKKSFSIPRPRIISQEGGPVKHVD